MSETLTQLADTLEVALRGRARKCGWSTVASPSALVDQGDLGIDQLLNALPNRAPEAGTETLPAFRRAFDLEPAAVSLLVCGLDAEEPEQSYRSALWWAGLIRARTTPIKRGDLHLFLIGPVGADGESSWRSRRALVESDERFCRKFVWLPSRAPTPDEVSSFLDRTFLAEPWAGESAEPRSLDPLERLIEDVGSNGSLSIDEAKRWIARLQTLGDGGLQEVAEDLVNILSERR